MMEGQASMPAHVGERRPTRRRSPSIRMPTMPRSKRQSSQPEHVDPAELAAGYMFPELFQDEPLIRAGFALHAPPRYGRVAREKPEDSGKCSGLPRILSWSQPP